jgi:hypothetical protein
LPASGSEGESFTKTEDLGIFLLAIAVVAPAALLGIGRWRERKQPKLSPVSASSVVWWAVAFVMAATSVGYAFARRDVVGFWDGMVGSWLATLLGIVCGVPVALELERQRRRAEDALKAEAAARLRLDVLTMLRGELERVTEQLKQRTDSPAGTLPSEPLKTSIWDATRASGNLAAIAEPVLLQAFGEAYRWLGMISTVEANRLELMHGNDRTFPSGSMGSDKLEEIVRTYLPEARKWVDYALSATAHLVSGSTSPP